MAVPAAAQQFVTDDATITPYRACQLEGWYGEAASWVLPACRFFRPLEVTAGVGFVADEDRWRAAAGAAVAGWAVGLAWTPPPLF